MKLILPLANRITRKDDFRLKALRLVKYLCIMHNCIMFAYAQTKRNSRSKQSSSIGSESRSMPVITSALVHEKAALLDLGMKP